MIDLQCVLTTSASPLAADEVGERGRRLRTIDRDQTLRTGDLGEERAARSVVRAHLDDELRRPVLEELLVPLDLVARLQQAEPPGLRGEAMADRPADDGAAISNESSVIQVSTPEG